MGEKRHCQDNIIEVRHCRQPSEEVGGTKLHFLSSSLHQVTSTELRWTSQEAKTVHL